MKVCVSSVGSTLDSSLERRFGRAPFFIIAETETENLEVVENEAVRFSGGAGISAAQTVVNKGISAVVTGNVGPKAMSVLQAAGISMFRGSPGSVKENLEQFKKGLLEEIQDASQPSGGRGGRR